MSRITKQPDIRKQELLDIGIELYFQYGDKGLTVAQVVKKANVAIGLFYYYFKSKEEFIDEALHCFIIKKIESMIFLFHQPYHTSIEKLNSILNTYFLYAEDMSPYRFDSIFHTERHYAMTNKLIQMITPSLIEFINKGVNEGIFNVNNTSLASCFILNGLSSIFDLKESLNEETFNELKHYIYRILGIEERGKDDKNMD